MTNIIMLGTGHGATTDLYNTCFVIQNESGVFLIDTGGGIEVIKRLSQSNIELGDVKNIFISHSHTDHILGLIWMFKKLYSKVIEGKIKSKINLYCNDVVYKTINSIAPQILDVYYEKVKEVINYVILNNGDKYEINGINYEFFDILAKGTKQFGFEGYIDGNRFVFLGDEPLNDKVKERVRGADYVTHEAFCLDKESAIFHPYEKNHSTALSVAEVMNDLDVHNIILYHTEESHKDERKKLYEEEAKSVYKGNVIVPDDLEVIKLKRKNI